MCRIAAYVGVPRTLDAVLYDAPRSLHEQAYAPAQQLHGNVNVDGTGVAWWPVDAPGPMRYASTQTPWADGNLRELAPYLRARAMIAAVRGATPGMPDGRGAVAPFVRADLAIAHNGWIGGFREGVAARLLATLPSALVGDLDVVTDSTVLALHVAARRARDASVADSVADTVRHAAEVARAAGQPATLNLVVSDGRRIVASRASVGGPCTSLYTLSDGEAPWSDGALVASEPLDDRLWREVPSDHLVEVSRDGVRTDALDLTVSA
jgi:glutamine amidotransferase